MILRFLVRNPVEFIYLFKRVAQTYFENFIRIIFHELIEDKKLNNAKVLKEK